MKWKILLFRLEYSFKGTNVEIENFRNFTFLKPIKADVKKFDFSKIKPIKFVLLDVDLYLPTINALENLRINMCSGGILIVDDVSKNNSWDGADQAFHEFVNKYSKSL